MATKIFVNLPVNNLKKSIEFFTKLDFTFNPQFTDDTATCMIVSEDIFIMLLTHDKFKTFTPKAICDAAKSTEVLICLSCESRDRVNDLVRKAVAANNLQSTTGPRLHVRSWISGPRWPHLGIDLYGAERNEARVGA